MTKVGAPRPPAGAPSLTELMDRAYAIVLVAKPLHPARSRVEWLVGEHELGARAIDALLAGGFLEKIARGDRLMLGERRRAVHLMTKTAGDGALRRQGGGQPRA